MDVVALTGLDLRISQASMACMQTGCSPALSPKGFSLDTHSSLTGAGTILCLSHMHQHPVLTDTFSLLVTM